MKEAAEVAAMQVKSSIAASIAAGMTYITSLGGILLSSVEWINQNDKFCLVFIAGLSYVTQLYFRRREFLIFCRTHDRRKNG